MNRDGGQRRVLLGDVERARESHPSEGRGHRRAGIRRRVALAAQVCQDDGAKPGVMQLDQQFRGGPIGEVAAGARDPALHHRGIRAGAELHFVVPKWAEPGVQLSLMQGEYSGVR